MGRLKTLLLALIWSFGVQVASAQHSSLNLGDSIGNGVVTAIGENADNRWIGTTDGLWRFWKDKDKYLHYTKSNSILPSNSISVICCRKDGNVWVGTDKGIFWFDGVSDILVSQENSKLPDLKIIAMAEDRNEYLWIGTANGGIMVLNGFHEDVFSKDNSNLPDNHIVAFALSEDGDVLISCWKQKQFRASVLKHTTKY